MTIANSITTTITEKSIMKHKAPEKRNIVHTTAQRCGAGRHKNKKDHAAKHRRSAVKNRDEPFWSSLFSFV